MKCAKCESSLHYGDKFCNVCGEIVEKGAYEEEYGKTIWGMVDRWEDKYETMTLKKVVDHWITKVIILVLVLGWGFIDAYTDLTNIKFLSSENYKIEYNKEIDEYYIRTNETEVDLNLYIPRHSEKITITEYNGDEVIDSRDMTPEEYKEKSVKVKNNKHNHITISSFKNEKITDTVKFYVLE